MLKCLHKFCFAHHPKMFSSGLMFSLSTDGRPSCYTCQLPPQRMSKEQHKWPKWPCVIPTLHQHWLAKHMLLIKFHFNMGDMKEVSYHWMIWIMLGFHLGMKTCHVWNETLTFAIFLLWQITWLNLLSPPMAMACVEEYWISMKYKKKCTGFPHTTF